MFDRLTLKAARGLVSPHRTHLFSSTRPAFDSKVKPRLRPSLATLLNERPHEILGVLL